MAEIKPFKALRFNTEKAGDISYLCCPPYDIISKQERKNYIKKNPFNVIRLELPDEGENKYKDVGKLLEKWKEQGVLVRDDEEALYIYEENFSANNKRMSIKGIIARVKLEEFSKGIILPHEHTLSKAKEDRFNLMKETNCNFSQIYALYMDDTHSILKTMDSATCTVPDEEFIDNDNVGHRLWILKDKKIISKIVNEFRSKKLFIADGHHRYETALNYRNYCRENGISKEGDATDYQMIYLMDMLHPGLVVYPTHRILHSLEHFNKKEVLEKCKEYFTVTEMTGISNIEGEIFKLYKEGLCAFGFYAGGMKWYLLVLKNTKIMELFLPDISEASRNLDVTVLHTLILEKIFGIDKENMANGKNLTYTKVFDEAIDSVAKKKSNCTFILNPTRVTEIRDVASQGEKMPQKSTYFYPKMITGMVMNELSD
ncbi:MAG: DUF1015 domain-containing protein [Acutalibacteraceae bacterium]